MPTLRTTLAALLFSLGPPGTCVLAQNAAVTPLVAPLQVTTDTPEYCNVLAERVARGEQGRLRTAPQIAALAEEGHQMCAAGRVRAGLLRLRRALLLLGSRG